MFQCMSQSSKTKNRINPLLEKNLEFFSRKEGVYIFFKDEIICLLQVINSEIYVNFL